MNKFYVAPDAELLRFSAAEAIADDDGLSFDGDGFDDDAKDGEE